MKNYQSTKTSKPLCFKPIYEHLMYFIIFLFFYATESSLPFESSSYSESQNEINPKDSLVSSDKASNDQNSSISQLPMEWESEMYSSEKNLHNDPIQTSRSQSHHSGFSKADIFLWLRNSKEPNKKMMLSKVDQYGQPAQDSTGLINFESESSLSNPPVTNRKRRYSRPSEFEPKQKNTKTK